MLLSVLVGFIGLAICCLSAYDAWHYWDALPYVRGRDYLMLAYYALCFLYGLVFVAC